MYYNKEVLPTQTDNGMDCIWAWPNTAKDHEWPEEDVMEFTANGLWFAPDCEKCFWTNKYLTHSDKICAHSWQPHRLDKIGGCILFPSLCWHKGFYHDEFNKTFIQAQLFAAPLMGKDMGHLTCSFAGKDFINRNLDKSVFLNLQTMYSQGRMQITLCQNFLLAPNSKTKRLIRLRTVLFLKTSLIRCHSFKILCTNSRKSFVT
jgi:hypothetical protein